MEHEQFTWASLIPGLRSLPAHVSNGIIVSVLLLVIVFLGYSQLTKRRDSIVPDEKLTFKNVAELIIEAISGLVEDTMGPRGKEFMLIIGDPRPLHTLQ